MAGIIRTPGAPERPPPTPDEVAAVRLKAEAGDPAAQLELGKILRMSPYDQQAEAVDWFRKASEKQNLAARGYLAQHMWLGIGCPHDVDAADKLFFSLLADDDPDGEGFMLAMVRIFDSPQHAVLFLREVQACPKGQVRINLANQIRRGEHPAQQPQQEAASGCVVLLFAFVAVGMAVWSASGLV